MHYFKRNIGDYAKKAGRLSMMEHGAYTLLLDACYDREQFPTEQDAIDWCWARTDAEIAAVKFVLAKFFTLEDDLYVQNRVREEIDAYHAKAAKNSEIARDREHKRKVRARNVHDTCSDGDEASPNQEPRTTNQEPIDKKQKGVTPDKPARFDPLAMELPSSLPLEIWERWIAYRRKRKLTTAEPTMRAQIANIVEWSSKHQCDPAEIIDASIANGWQGLFEPKHGHSAPRKPRMNVIGVDAETPEGFQDGFR